MTRDLFKIKRAVEAGAYDRILSRLGCAYRAGSATPEFLDRLADDLFRVRLPVAKPTEGTVAAGSVSEETNRES